MSQLFGSRVVKGKAITFGLFLTNAGAGVDPALVAGDVKIQRTTDGAPVNIAALPTKLVGSAAGAHLLTLAVGETNVAGPLLVQIVKAGVDTLVAFVDVTTGLVEILDAVIEGPSQYDGQGEALPPGGVLAELDLTVAQWMREVFAYVANAATGLDGANTVFKSIVGGRNRIVATLNNGNRQITSRNKT